MWVDKLHVSDVRIKWWLEESLCVTGKNRAPDRTHLPPKVQTGFTEVCESEEVRAFFTELKLIRLIIAI